MFKCLKIKINSPHQINADLTELFGLLGQPLKPKVRQKICRSVCFCEFLGCAYLFVLGTTTES